MLGTKSPLLREKHISQRKSVWRTPISLVLSLLLVCGIYRTSPLSLQNETAVGVKCGSFLQKCPGKAVKNEDQDCPAAGCTQEACCSSSTSTAQGGSSSAANAAATSQSKAAPANAAATSQSKAAAANAAAISQSKADTAQSAGRPIVLISDIGRDIDDTLAMAALAGFVKAGKANPVGFIATGYNEATVQARLGLLRWWVNRLGMGNPLMTGCVSGKNDEGTHLPNGAVADASFKDDNCKMAAQMITELSGTYSGQLEIFAIAGMGALKAALEHTDGLLNLKAIWIQGQWLEKDGKLAPEFKAHNLNIDEDASKFIFAELQDRVPFKLLGKWAAYQTKVMVDDFIALNKVDPSSDILETALRQMDSFRKKAKFVMWHLYPGRWNDNPLYALGHPDAKMLPMDEAKAEEVMGKKYPTDNEWCSMLTCLSMPYDPNLILWGFGDDGLFSPERKTIGGITHEVVGNVPETPGVPNPQTAKSALITIIKEGLTGSMQVPGGSAKPPPVCPDITARALGINPPPKLARSDANRNVLDPETQKSKS